MAVSGSDIDSTHCLVRHVAQRRITISVIRRLVEERSLILRASKNEMQALMDH